MFGNRTGAFRFKQRAVWFRLGAVLIGLLPFLLFELVLYGTGWQPPGSVADPYVGFTEIRPLFELDPGGTRYVVSATRYPLFCPEEFLVEKPENEFRIFCVGGSTVQGRPFAIETAFSTWLELRLQAAGRLPGLPDAETDWNVINCGGVSYASYRLAPIIEEIVNYQPDLIVLYTGHNEFLEDRTYASVKMTSPLVVRTHERLSSIRTYAFMRSLVVGDSQHDQPPEQLPADVEARLDFRDGLKQYHRDDEWKRNVTGHFEHNLRTMARVATGAGVPLILCNPVANLRDASPFKSQNSQDLTSDEIQMFSKLYDSLIREDRARRSLAEETRILEQLVAMDPRHADVQYRLGQSIQQLGQFEKAKTHLIRAKEEDVCPLRIIEPMYGSISRVSREFKIPVVDVKSFFENRAPDGIPGRESLLDHVHPSIHGHQLISEWLFDEMVQQKMVERKDDSGRQVAAFESHLASLPFMYFELGKDRLAGLKRWAEGKVTRQRDGDDQ